MLSSLKGIPLPRCLLRTYPRAWGGAMDVLFGALDAWTVELLSTIRGPDGAATKAVAAYVALLVVSFAVPRLVFGPGRLEMRTRRARGDASA